MPEKAEEAGKGKETISDQVFHKYLTAVGERATRTKVTRGSFC